MAQYTVLFRQSCYYGVTVDAESREEAERLARNDVPDDIFDWSDFEIEVAATAKDFAECAAIAAGTEGI